MRKLLYILPIFLFLSCENSNPNFQEEAADSEFVHRSMKKITDVIVHDIFSPPTASRIYAYTSIAGYEAMLSADSSYQSLAGQLTGFQAVPQPKEGGEICYSLASVHAMLTVGKTLIFSEDKIVAFQDEIYAEFHEIHRIEALT